MSPQPSLQSSLRALPPAAWILFFGTFLNRFGTFVVPFLALYMTQKGYSPGQAATAIGAYGVGNMIATTLGGILADRFGRRRTIALSMFSGAGAMLLLSQASGFPTILALAAFAGLTGELYRPCSSALLADLVPPSNRVTAFSTYRMAINAGWAFGPATAGFLAGHGYFWLFAGDAATSALFGAIALFALPKTAHPQAVSSREKSAVGALLEDKKLHRVLFASFAMALVFNQFTSTYGLAVMHLGFSPATYGALLSLNGALVVLIELPLTTVTRRFPARNVIALGYFLCGLGFALNAFAATVPAFAVCAILFTFGEMCSMPVASAYVADLAPPHLRGRYMGTYGLTWTVAQVIGPALGMSLLAKSSSVYWVAGGVLGIIAAIAAKGPKSPLPSRSGRSDLLACPK